MAELPRDLSSLPAYIESCAVFNRALIFSELESTNRHLKQLARAGEAEGTVVIADHQTAGHGRHGRAWYSPAGLNLYLSALFRPPLKPQAAPVLPLFAAVCVADRVKELSGIRPGIKWPNDVLLRGKKCAGILVDVEADAERVDWAVIGIGLNVNGREWPEDLRSHATSLAEQSGKEMDRAHAAAALIRSLDAGYIQAKADEFSSVREKWLGYDMLSGERVRVTERGTVTEGVVLGYDGLGAMILGDEEGSQRKVFSGDVERVRRA